MGFFDASDESVVPLSAEHKVTAPAERERLIQSGIALGENQSRLNGLSVARALGDHFAKEVKSGIIATPYVSDAVRVTAPRGSFVVLASDGLWDVMSGDEAVRVVRGLGQVANEVAAAEKLIEMALAKPACLDNITVGVVYF